MIDNQNQKQNVFITGVGQRIGLYLAKRFIEAGYHVIGTYRSERGAILELQRAGAELYKVDFYRQEEVDLLINTILHRHTQLRALIHNASEWLPDDEYASDILDKMFQVHVQAPYKMNMAFGPLLKQSPTEFSDIIHFSDYAASTGSAKHTAYAASKAALNNFTLSFAAKYAPKVKVNAIAPGLILFNEHDSDIYRQQAVKKALIQREGGLEEIGESVFHLLNSRFITGRVMPIDGGRHLVTKQAAQETHRASDAFERIEPPRADVVAFATPSTTLA